LPAGHGTGAASGSHWNASGHGKHQEVFVCDVVAEVFTWEDADVFMVDAFVTLVTFGYAE
jgi:hypothetical protein